MYNYYIRGILVICFLNARLNTWGIKITDLNVPNVVKNNTNRPLTLDCDYSVDSEDSELVLQWFLNGNLVYQWIPPHQPQSLGVFKDRLKVGYKSSNDSKTMYRALKILNPTTNMSGKYKCSVSSLKGHAARAKKMIVMEPEDKLMIWKTMDQQYLNVTCLAVGIYPSPNMLIFRKSSDHTMHTRMKYLSITEWNVKVDPISQKHNITVVGTDNLSEVDANSLIHCELNIPGTGYTKRKSVLYHPLEFTANVAATNQLLEYAIVVSTICYLTL